MDRKTRLQVEDNFEKNGGLYIPTEYGNIFIPKKARVLEGGGPRVKKNWGEDIRLEAGITVLTKDGEVKEDREWDSKSFTRWFSRLMQTFFDASVAGITDQTGGAYSIATGQGFGGNPQYPPSTSANPIAGLPGGQGSVGANLAIGNGAFVLDSGAFNLQGLLFFQNAYFDTITTVDTSAASSWFTTTGITLATISGATITEIGLFTKLVTLFTGGQLRQFLMAYDEVSPGVVTAYGDVIAPKYTMTFSA